ncbi:N-acetyltransferase domain-containing protein [Candidatus Magnetomoraceae bacterium gMMP-15]
MIQFENYPKKVTLNDGFTCALRPMQTDDQDAMYRFFIALSEKVTKYLRNDVTDRILIEQWCRTIDYEKILPIVALDGERIIANASLQREGFGWGRHIGEIRITIASEFYQRGLSSVLVEEITEIARKAGLEKLCAKIVTSRKFVIKVFEKNGFTLMSNLKNFVKIVHGNEYRDIAVMVKDLKPVTQGL